MKGIFFLFLTANALFFIWHYFYEQPAKTPQAFTAPASNDDVAKLVLVEEATPGTLRAAGSEPAQAETAAPQSSESVVDEAMEMVAAPEAAPDLLMPMTAPVELPEPLVMAEPELEPEPEPTPALCYTLGPIAEETTRNNILTRLEGARFGVEKRTTEEVASTRYWVLIPPRKSTSVANRLSRDLKQKGIDNYVILSGKRNKAVSLGVFKEQSSAVGLKKRAHRAGYRETYVDSDKRMKRLYWLDVAAVDGRRLDEGLWDQISSDYPELKRTERKPCE